MQKCCGLSEDKFETTAWVKSYLVHTERTVFHFRNSWDFLLDNVVDFLDVCWWTFTIELKFFFKTIKKNLKNVIKKLLAPRRSKRQFQIASCSYTYINKKPFIGEWTLVQPSSGSPARSAQRSTFWCYRNSRNEKSFAVASLRLHYSHFTTHRTKSVIYCQRFTKLEFATAFIYFRSLL